MFSADQNTLSPIAETFLLCGNVYLGNIFWYYFLFHFNMLHTWALARTRGLRCQDRCSSWGSSGGPPPSLPRPSAHHAWLRSPAEKNNVVVVGHSQLIHLITQPGFCLGALSCELPWTPCQTTCSQHSSVNIVTFKWSSREAKKVSKKSKEVSKKVSPDWGQWLSFCCQRHCGRSDLECLHPRSSHVSEHTPEAIKLVWMFPAKSHSSSWKPLPLHLRFRLLV